jgi:signal transduction histidine kinase
MSVAPSSTIHRLPRDYRSALPDPRRTSDDRLEREIRVATGSPIITALLDAVDSVLLVLNEQRQIVAFSEGAARAASRDVRGLRPGEALSCVNAQGPGGCGTQAACQTCAKLGTILTANRCGHAVDAECLLRSTIVGGRSTEFHVRSSPVAIDDARFTVVSLRDVSSEKRREALEQLFFHDVLNTVSGLRGWGTLLRLGRANLERAGERIDLLTRQVEREIRDQRDLLMAEDGTLVPQPVALIAADLLKELEAVFSLHSVARERHLAIEVLPSELVVHSDPALLLRVLVNMVRNAFEATPPGGVVRVRAERERAPQATHDGAVKLSVHNGGVMPIHVQQRVFTRSFTTKGERGRGLGTYGMKLLGERHLKGEVAFVSTPEDGTTFFIRLPGEARVHVNARSDAARWQRARRDAGVRTS